MLRGPLAFCAEPVYNRSVSEQVWFVPGRLAAPGVPLARYRPLRSVGAVGSYVRALTTPGDLVVDLFCQGPTVARETVDAGRRALGLSVNPLLLVAARLGLVQRDADAVNAAFTHMADSLKGDVPLRHHLSSLYTSACPACGEQGTALWFAWDRDGGYPFEKAVDCPRCGEVQQGAPDDQDVENAGRIPPRGLSYYYALDRAAPPDHPARERAAELVELYTPRNLSALVDLAMRLEELDVDERVRIVLTAVLLDCFDAGSSLDPHGEERPRPRTLRLPSLYLERNVWSCFKRGLSRLLESPSPPPVPGPSDLEPLLASESGGYALASHAARRVRKLVQPGSAALVVVDPPRPDAVFWALSALWAGWLWESPAARRLRPFLRRRRFDWDWHQQVLQAALEAAGPLLTADGHLLTLFSDPESALRESVCLAAAGAGFALEGWGHSPEAGDRLVWRWEGAKPAPAQDAAELAQDVEAGAREAAAGALRRRGEPTIQSILHASACAALAGQGLMARAVGLPEEAPPPRTLVAEGIARGLEAVPTIRLKAPEEGDHLLWLAEPAPAAEPLADQVEARVWEVLLQRSSWDLDPLVHAVYAHLDGPLTPDLALVLVCVDSYSVRDGGEVSLRSEDDPVRRAAEVKDMRTDLAELGRRLGFRVSRRGGWDVRWLEAGEEMYVFAVSSMAALAHHLLAGRAVDDEAERCLVLPGGRAHLATFKLRRDPRLERAVEEHGWQFIKFRHLRRLVAKEELDRHALKTVLGLDPIAEQEAAQIPLF